MWSSMTRIAFRVSNSRSDTVSRFPANDPTKVETFRVGVAPRALALDSKSNVSGSSASCLRISRPEPLPPHATIMEEFKASAPSTPHSNQGR